jgi:hypothetical protein
MRRIVYLLFFISLRVAAQNAPAYPPLVNFTSDQDKDNMMKQLGIISLRPGPSGDEKAPNHANYDEALANPYPDYPEILTLKNGKKVTTPEQWWKLRRPEIVEDFERRFTGAYPKTYRKLPGRLK